MKQFAVIGDPIAHSLSPVLHREIYRQINLEANYEKIHLMPNALHSFMSENDLDVFNVTIPHKQSIIPFLDMLMDPGDISLWMIFGIIWNPSSSNSELPIS